MATPCPPWDVSAGKSITMRALLAGSRTKRGARITEVALDLNEVIPMVADHAGDDYLFILSRLHGVLRPKSYLEIGVFTGMALQHARCESIAVDPAFQFRELDYLPGITAKPILHLYQMGSDDFFAAHSPKAIFGRPVDMAFLDGMHRCEFLLRDFINTEKECRKNSVVGLHDCLPVELPMTTRVHGAEPSVAPHRAPWWTGDVWRTALLLRRRRPDLSFTVLDAAPTGLVLITNLDPANTSLADDYQGCVAEMMSWNLQEIGIPRLFEELNVESTAVLAADDLITARFWL